jgi:ribosome modulation factor
MLQAIKGQQDVAEGARSNAIKQGYQAAVKGLSKQQNPYYKSANGKTPPAAYDWEAGWEDARDSGKIPQSGLGEAIAASGPSRPLDDSAVKKIVWDTMKINADTGEQAIQRALAVLAKKPQSRMVRDLQDKIQNLADRLAQGIAESAKPGEYYIHTVYFKDGTKKRIRVTSDEFDVADYYTKRGQAVDRVDYDFQLHSDMTEGLKSTLAGAALAGAMALGGAGAAQAQSASSGPNIVNATTIIQQIQSGKIQNQNDLSAALGDNQSNRRFVFKQLQHKAGLPGHGADSVINAIANKSPAGAQQPAKSAGQSGVIIQRPTDNFEGRIKEDQDTSGVEQAILKRIMVAHLDLLRQYGPEKVMQAAEEVAYNVGDVDEIGTSDVSAYVAQVKQILGATP